MDRIKKGHLFTDDYFERQLQYIREIRLSERKFYQKISYIIPMSMEDWAQRLDGFLEFNGNEILTGPGKISHVQAKLHAETEYEKYRLIQDRLFESDFDRVVKQIEGTDDI